MCEIRIPTHLATIKQIKGGEARIALSLFMPGGNPKGLVHLTVKEARSLSLEIAKAINEVARTSARS